MPPNIWLIVKDTGTGELSLVNSIVRQHQLQLWAVNCIIVPSIVIKEFTHLENASDYLIEMLRVSKLLKSILNEKDA